MKTRLLKITLLCVITLFFFNCRKKCEECKDCDDFVKKQKAEIVNEIEKEFDDLFQPFHDIKLSVFLGEKTNIIPQHLHIEGSIGNPFFIAGTFTSKNISSTKCEISALKLEIIASGVTGAKVINYKFDGDPTVTSDGKGGLNINVKIIKDDTVPSRIPNSSSLTLKPITVNHEGIIDMHVDYTGTKKDSLIEGFEFDKCCAPVICKTIIHIIHP